MCQLLAMSSRQPAALDFSFTGFAQRSAEHGDGWGIALHNGSDCQLYTDALACSNSALAQQFRARPIKARNVIAHIRKATQGRVSLENSHPFTRRLWGQTWSFAHNGDLKLFHPRAGLYAPWGDIDSELAFCHILSELALRYEHQPPRHQLFATRPLTSNEAWQPFARGELKLFVQGEEVGAQPVRQQEWDLQICA